MSPIYDDEKILLSVEHLTTRFIIDKKSIPIIHDITFSIKKGGKFSVSSVNPDAVKV